MILQSFFLGAVAISAAAWIEACGASISPLIFKIMSARKLALSDDCHNQCFYHEGEKVNSKNWICAISNRVVSEHNKALFFSWWACGGPILCQHEEFQLVKAVWGCLNITYNLKLVTMHNMKHKYLCRFLKSGQITFGEIQKWFCFLLSLSQNLSDSTEV